MASGFFKCVLFRINASKRPTARKPSPNRSALNFGKIWTPHRYGIQRRVGVPLFSLREQSYITKMCAKAKKQGCCLNDNKVCVCCELCGYVVESLVQWHVYHAQRSDARYKAKILTDVTADAFAFCCCSRANTLATTM